MDTKAQHGSKSRLQQKVESQYLLMDAARHEFGTKPYAAATVRTIAKEANRSMSIVYGHFADKEFLFAEVVKEYRLESESLMLRAARPRDNDMLGKLVCFFAAEYEHQLPEPYLFQNAMAQWWAGEPEVSNQMWRMQEFARVHVGALLQAAKGHWKLDEQTDISLLSTMVWESFVGVCTRAHAHSMTMNVSWMREQLQARLEVIFFGLYKPSS